MNLLTGCMAVTRYRFLWCFGRVRVPLLSYRSWRFTRFDRRAVHLESFQLTALEAAFVYDATVVQAPRVGAVACRLAEIKAPVPAHKLQRVHKLRPAQSLRPRPRRHRRQRERAQQQQQPGERAAARHTAHGPLQDITQMSPRHPSVCPAKTLVPKSFK